MALPAKADGASRVQQVAAVLKVSPHPGLSITAFDLEVWKHGNPNMLQPIIRDVSRDCKGDPVVEK